MLNIFPNNLRFSRLAIFILCLSLIGWESGVLESFGPRGPYTHEKVNEEAFKNFSRKTGFEVRVDCAEHINQANYQADVQLPMKPEYHCDNSEFYRCSMLLEELKASSLRDPNWITSLRKLGLATHIIQDFYAHSNWVEITRSDYAIAPIENLKDFFLLIPQLQSGWHPFSPEGTPEEQVECFFAPEDEWGMRILGATHGCMEKDSNFSIRGSTVSNGPLAYGRTYHELAGEIAIDHTTKIFQEMYDKRHPVFMTCLVPSFRRIGCNQYIYGRLRGL